MVEADLAMVRGEAADQEHLLDWCGIFTFFWK
jgi:hypothetical protein